MLSFVQIKYCDVCGSTWGHKSSLTRHVEIHRELLRCPHCPNRAPFLLIKPYKKHLKRHETIAGSQGRFWNCPDCCEAFFRSEHLQAHRARAHGSGDQTFGCDDCGEEKKTHLNLAQHSQLHTGRQLPCEICGRKFKWRNLKEHVLRSHYERSIPCQKCPKLFASKKALGAHARVAHGERKFRCEACAYAAPNAHKLKRHLGSASHTKYGRGDY